MDRLVYRIIDCITLVILVLIGINVGATETKLLLALGVPSAILLYFTWKVDNSWLRIMAFSCLLYSFFYQSISMLEGYYSLIVLTVISLFLRPPLHFLRTTVYSVWAVALYLFWQNAEFSMSGWQLNLQLIFADMDNFLPYILLLGYFSGLYLNYFEKGYRSQNLYVIVLGIAGAFVLVPFYLLLGGFKGLFQSLYEYWVTFIKVLKVRPKIVRHKLEHYLASTAVEDWKTIWSRSFNTNRNTVSDWYKEGKKYFGQYGFILAAYYSLSKLTATITVTLVSPVVNVLFSLFHLLVLICCSIVYQILRLGFYNVDILYRKIHKVEMICPTCYHQNELPVYVCSQCHTSHDDLVPNHFGIFKRRCTCGNKMPTSILNGRSDLTAQCPNCNSAYEGKETTPVVIPILGVRMAGKTSFWAKSVQQIGDSTLKERGISYEWVTTEQATNFVQLMNKVNAMQAPSKTDVMLPKAWTLRLMNKEWARNKVVYLFDPMGNAFDRTDLMKKMGYLSYSDGNILVVDVAAMVPKKESFQYEQRNPADKSPEELIDRLLLYYQEEMGIKVHEKIGTPLAIVFHKVDQGVHQQVANEVSVSREFGNGSHDDCKQWLQENGFHNLLRKLDHQFTTYRFFISSSFNDAEGVAPAKVMSWILNCSDKGLKLVEKGEGSDE